MIIFELKDFVGLNSPIGGYYTIIKEGNKISFKDPNVYISNVEIIDNEYDDILFKSYEYNDVNDTYWIYYESETNYFHNPIGPAVIEYRNNKIHSESYWLNNRVLTYKKWLIERKLNNY